MLRCMRVGLKDYETEKDMSLLAFCHNRKIPESMVIFKI